MSTNEIKGEIKKVLDHLSDKALSELLKFLKELDLKDNKGISSSALLNKILQEDKDLLAKLAQ
jgi:arsenate reductase-like glutaredoxin family protein